MKQLLIYPNEEPQQDYGQQENYEQTNEQQSYEQQSYEQSSGGGVGQCKALYDYGGDNEGDLAFKEGGKWLSSSSHWCNTITKF